MVPCISLYNALKMLYIIMNGIIYSNIIENDRNLISLILTKNKTRNQRMTGFELWCCSEERSRRDTCDAFLKMNIIYYIILGARAWEVFEY